MRPKIDWTVDACWQEWPAGELKVRVSEDRYMTKEPSLYICANLTFKHKFGVATELCQLYWDDTPLDIIEYHTGTRRIGDSKVVRVYVQWAVRRRDIAIEKDKSIVGQIRIESTRWNVRKGKQRALRRKPKNVWSPWWGY